MTDLLRTIKARHKFNAFFTVWCLTFAALDFAAGSPLYGVIMLFFAALMFGLALVAERQHRRHVAAMQRIKAARNLDEMLDALRRY